ncbi:hypothetical protein [Haliscomenobacter hydrossis]|uniref:Uncharacterized protein n=1 Tax=Haliscomenobacter hydrossis (strain ATCC 27775 / DSM 1100 / LMG 10767 / O) TaxID=760192 RepID=F4KRC6_HALH1|nr:hypothetical protein [Haliscomenobacter hydrossis]AEE47916.1 hypothetical protein Halhy_0002 [Haliscomenobacter hydrossis DSM 1100]
MNDEELKALWQTQAQKLEENLLFTRKNAEEISKMKVQSALASMKPLKIFTIIVGILWVGFVDLLIINSWPFGNLFFLVSAAIQVILTKLAIGVYLYQLVLIAQVDLGTPVLEAQEKMARLKASTLWVTRLLFLQLPIWTTFYLNVQMLKQPLALFINLLLTVLFTWAALWLFFNIKYENRHKKWFRLIFEGKEWTPVIQSMELLDEIRDFQVEEEYV